MRLVLKKFFGKADQVDLAGAEREVNLRVGGGDAQAVDGNCWEWAEITDTNKYNSLEKWFYFIKYCSLCISTYLFR